MTNDVSEDCLIEYACFDERVRGGISGQEKLCQYLEFGACDLTEYRSLGWW